MSLFGNKYVHEGIVHLLVCSVWYYWLQRQSKILWAFLLLLKKLRVIVSIQLPLENN